MDRDFETMPASLPLARVFQTIENSKESYFIVVDGANRMKGVLSFQDIRSLLSQHSLDFLVIAQDLVKTDTMRVGSQDTLEQAYHSFGLSDLQMIPVVDSNDPDRVIGVIRRDDLISYYNKRLLDTLRQ
jgi:CIC family chloride channel protein